MIETTDAYAASPICSPSRAAIMTGKYPARLNLTDYILKPQQHQDGISLQPLLEDRQMDERPLFWHYPHYSGGLGGRPSGAVRLGDYKLIEFFEDNRIELYNLKNDIKEKTDLAEAKPEKAEELKQLLHQWRKDVGAQMPFSNPAYIGQE